MFLLLDTSGDNLLLDTSGDVLLLEESVGTPDIHVHLFDYDIDGDGDYQVPARVGLGTVNATGHIHNHGDAVLTVASAQFVNEVNCDVMLVLAAPGMVGTYDPDESREFILEITPTTYGAWSFDLVVTSDDPDTPVLTVTFEGMAYGTQVDIGWTAPNRRLEWTAPNRRLEWTAPNRRLEWTAV